MNAEKAVQEAGIVQVTQKSAIEKRFQDDMDAARALATPEDIKVANEIVSGVEPVCIRTIAPAVAAVLFRDHNGKNRDLSIPKVRDYQAAMERGEWKPTHQGYAFDAKGNTVDGQHREAAQALSNVSLSMVIYRNADRAIIDAIDLAKPRKAYEALEIAGIANAGEKERIARAAMEYAAKVEGRTLKPTLIQLEQYVTRNDQILSAAIERGRQSSANIAEPCLSETQAALIAYLMHIGEWPAHLIPAFLTTLQAGVEQREHGVIVPTARIMLAAKRKEKKTDSLSRDQQIATILRAAGHWARGESVARFKPAKKTELVDYHATDIPDLARTAA
jgi:hypothetical protein